MTIKKLISNSEGQRYLTTCKVTEDDPAIYIAWHDDSVAAFVSGSNEFPRVPQPQFITTLPGQMTVHSIKSDIVARLSQVSGGRHQNALLAPNTMDEFARVLTILTRNIEMDPFMQDSGNQHLGGSHLATIYRISDKTIANATAIGLPAPAQGYIQLFE